MALPIIPPPSRFSSSTDAVFKLKRPAALPEEDTGRVPGPSRLAVRFVDVVRSVAAGPDGARSTIVFRLVRPCSLNMRGTQAVAREGSARQSCPTNQSAASECCARSERPLAARRPRRRPRLWRRLAYLPQIAGLQELLQEPPAGAGAATDVEGFAFAAEPASAPRPVGFAGAV
jgi:hypothetical protein